MKALRKNSFLSLSRNCCGAVLAAISFSAVQGQTTGTWNYNSTAAASLSWNTTGSWTGLTGGQVPNAVGATPNFTMNITAGRAITLDGNKTVGTLTIDDAGSSFFAYTLNAGSPATSRLTFDVASGNAVISTPTVTNTATNSVSVPITLNDPLELNISRTNVTGGLSIGGEITDGASNYSLTKNGNGALTLLAANTYDGGTFINGGRIQASNLGSYGSGGVTVASGGQALLLTTGSFANSFTIAGNGLNNTSDSGALVGAIRFQNNTIGGAVTLSADARIGAVSGTTGTITGAISGTTRNLEINSTSNATHNGNIALLGNASGLTGTVTVANGTLRLGTASNLGGNLVVQDGARLFGDQVDTPGGATLAGNMTLGGTTGATFHADASSSAAMTVNGSVTLNGVNTVAVSGVTGSGTVLLMNYSGALTGGGANLTLPGGMATYRPGTAFTTSGNEIKLTVVRQPLLWTGLSSSNWDTTEVNWKDGPTDTAFYNLDAVTFDDTSTINNISIPTGVIVSPSVAEFNHSAVDYNVTGAGLIDGGTRLIKNGTGILTLATANAYAGGTELNQGTLRIGNASALGIGTLSITGGKLSSDGTTARTVTNPVTLNGSMILSDAADNGAMTFNGVVTLAGNSSIEAPTVLGNAQTMNNVITDGASSFQLTTRGTTASFTFNGANSYDGGTVIESGRVSAAHLQAFGTGLVTVQSGGQAYLTIAGTFTNAFRIAGDGVSEPSGVLGAIRLQSGANAAGPIGLAGNARVTAHGNTGTLSGVISEVSAPSALELSNYNTATDSTITVTGNNTYTGGTTVKGAIVIANHNSAFGTGTVTVESNGTAARTTRVQLGTDVVINNDMVINSSANTAFRGAVHSYSGSLTTPSLAVVNGDIEIQSGVGNGGHLAAESASLSVLRVMGAINVTNGVAPSIRVGTVELGGGGNYTQLNHQEGTLRLVAANGISTSAILSTGLSGATVIDLNGLNQTLAGITKGSFGGTVINNGAVASTLTMNMPTSTSYSGTIAPGLADIHLVKTGVGVLTLSGDSSTALGSLVVNGGGVNLTGTLGTTSYSSTINAGGILSGEGTMGGNMTFNGGTLQINPATTTSLLNSGNLSTTGGVAVELSSSPVDSNPIEVIAFSGTHTGNATNFTLVNAGNYRNPQFQVNANNVTLTFGAPVGLTWTGVGGNTWDINATSNWVDSVPAASKFFISDVVTFGDTGSGTVVVNDTISATSITINSNQPYSFEGTGTIQTGSLTKDGTGAASITTPWAINGPVTLTAGSLALSVPAAQSLTSALSGAGTLVKNGSAALTVTQANTGFTGTTVISQGSLIPSTNTSLGSAPKITIGDAATLATDVLSLTLGTGLTIGSAILSPTITVEPTCLDARITSEGSTMTNTAITKRGTGRLSIGHASNLGATTNFVTGTSSVTIEAGTLAGSSQTPISASTTITMGNANTGTAATIVELPANQTINNDVVTLSCPLVLSADAPNSEAIFRYPNSIADGSLSFNGTIALNGRDIIFENTSNINSTTDRPTFLYNVQGAISGNGNVRMRGNSGTTIRIQGANTFTGDFYLLSGRVQTAFGGTAGDNIPNTARIIMSPGATFSLSNTGETVRGLVGGAATESIPTPALINQGRGDTTLCRLTVSDNTAANTHVFDGTVADRVITSPPSTAPMALTKAGAATQVLNGVHTYTGSTIVTGGTLEIGGAGQLGAGTYTSIVDVVSAPTETSPGSTLKFNSTANQILRTSGTNDLRGAGTLVKDNTGTLTIESTITAGHAFSGNITINGGTLIGLSAVNGSGGQPALGSRVNTRTFTINNGGTLQLNSGNILSSSHTGTTAPKLVINSGGTVTNGGTATNNALNNIELNGGTLTSTTGHTSSADPFLPLYGAYNINGTVTSTGNSTISTSDPVKGWIMLKVAGNQIGEFNVASGTLTVSAPLGQDIDNNNIGSLNKTGTGTMVLSGVNFYTGATTVSQGTLALVGGSQTSPITVSSGASLGFTIGSPTTSTSTFNLSAGTIKITGTPSEASHTLITSSAGITGTPVLDAPVPGYQLKVIGNSLVLQQAAGYSSWAGVNGAGPNLNDDHDNDGVPNGVEYFLGGPNGSTSGFTALPGVTNASGTLSVTWVMGTDYAGVYNTDFTVETSDTLTGTWSTESVGVTVNITGSNVTYTFPTPLGTKKFARLKVTGP